MKVAYILSMATVGLTAWNFREIDILTRNGVEIHGYPLTWDEGPYMPRPEWRFRRPSARRALLAQPRALLRWPRAYLRLLFVALRSGSLSEFLLATDFAQEMADEGIEHIHCHFGDRKLTTGYYCHELIGLPLSVTVHAYEILVNPNPAMFRRAALACDTIVTVTEFNRQELVKRYDLPAERIRVVRIHGDVSEDPHRGAVRLLIAAEFREKKGHEVLLRALGQLDRADLVLWVAGDGQLDVPQMARELGVADRVVFMGRLGYGALSVLYDTCDIFVLPSRTAANGDREGLPVALMEAMSRRKPVISTRHVGIPEMVRHGLLVDENDVDGLAAAIARLADDAELRRELGEQNHRIIKEEYSESTVLELKEVFRPRA